MHAANQVIAVDETVGHQGAAMRTAAVQNGDTVIETHDDQVHVSDQRVRRRTVLQFIPIRNAGLFHMSSPVCARVEGDVPTSKHTDPGR
jgi:hypothetical protein